MSGSNEDKYCTILPIPNITPLLHTSVSITQTNSPNLVQSVKTCKSATDLVNHFFIRNKPVKIRKPTLKIKECKTVSNSLLIHHQRHAGEYKNEQTNHDNYFDLILIKFESRKTKKIILIRSNAQILLVFGHIYQNYHFPELLNK